MKNLTRTSHYARTRLPYTSAHTPKRRGRARAIQIRSAKVALPGRIARSIVAPPLPLPPSQTRTSVKTVRLQTREFNAIRRRQIRGTRTVGEKSKYRSEKNYIRISIAKLYYYIFVIWRIRSCVSSDFQFIKLMIFFRFIKCFGFQTIMSS